MAKVIGVGGVFFRSDDPEGLYACYERHLGLRRGPGGVVIFPWRRDDDPEKSGMTIWSPFPRDTDYFGLTRPAFMVNYVLDDLDGLLADLRAKGADVDDRREDSEYGRFAWVSDPEGNRVEQWQPPARP